MFNIGLYSPAMQSGKCHGKGTRILMFNGSIKNVEDIKVGELIMGDDSTPRKVISLARGREKMYKIQPLKGEDSFTCNESHILSLKCSFSLNTKYVTGKVVNISIKDYLNESAKFRQFFKLYRKGVEFEESPLEVDPYIYGLWLGDGTTLEAHLTTGDEELADLWTSYGKSIGLSKCKAYARPNANCYTYRISTGITGGSFGNPFRKFIRSSLIEGHKRIPKNFLINSRDNRLKLLAGIIDSDGYSEEGKSCRIVTKLRGLAEDYRFLARSLGFRSHIRNITKGITKLDFKGNYFEVFVGGDLTSIPTVLKRKKFITPKNKTNPMLSPFIVTSLGEGDYYGFELDGNHLYMLDTFIVTHNTTFSDYLIANYNYERVVLAKTLKKMTEAFIKGLGYSEEMIYRMVYGDLKETVIPEIGKTPRYLQQTIGTQWGRTYLGDSVWINIGTNNLDKSKSHICEDVRFLNEADTFREKGFKLIKIIRPNAIITEEHESEGMLNDYPFDKVIINDGTIEDFYKKISIVMEEFKNGQR